MRLRSVTLLFLLLATFTSIAQPLDEARLETPRYRFTLAAKDGTWTLQDSRTGVAWKSSFLARRFGEAQLRVNGQVRTVDLAACQLQQDAHSIEATFHPVNDRPTAFIRVKFASSRHGEALDVSYEASPDLHVERLRLLDNALSSTSAERGQIIVPVREGLLIPADSGKEFNQSFDTYNYEGCHLAMIGLVKNGSALLVTWTDPYVAADVRSATPKDALQTLALSLSLRKTARSFTLVPLGPGDFVTVGQAYRQFARERGYVVTWDEKIGANPERAKYIGATNFKLWSALDRRMDEESKVEKSVRVNWTFDEAAEVAEHLRNDLKLDKVLFTVGGWIRRGYDNQHPDVLPAAPELGGDEKLAQLSKRVMNLGYVFSLHDNYQDIYRDSPSWDEQFIMKTPDGKLAKGGKWAGGLAYLTCSPKALELARRPRNLPAVKKLTNANSYFIDTTYAAGLQECFDPGHPLTRSDDIRYKQELSDYARNLFGTFGSECGREWAIPHADFFEGLTGVSGTYYHNKDLVKNVGGIPFPLFEVVYRDTIAAYGKYGYDIHAAAEYFLHHLNIARPLHHHNVPSHLYWKNLTPSTNTDPRGMYARAENGWANGMHPYDVFLKNTHEVLSPLNELTAKMRVTACQFLTPDGRVRKTTFGEGPNAVIVTTNSTDAPLPISSRDAGPVTLAPYGFLVESPTFVAFCANHYNGINYNTPSMFTLRLTDAKPLPQSKSIRIFHAFGHPDIRIHNRTHTIPREATVRANE